MRRVKLAIQGFGSVVLVLIGLALLCTSCSESDDEMLLEPPGEVTEGSGVIRGVLTFDGGSGGGAQATIYALREYAGSCDTQYSSIHMTGTHVNWDTSIWDSTPGMRYLGGCTWADEVELPTGTIEWKFVTDKAWDNPPDYVSTGGEDGLRGTTEATTGDNLGASIPAVGTYDVFLFEGTDPPSYMILTEEEAPIARSDPATGAFEIADLPAGMYELIAIAHGYLDSHVSEVVLEDGEEKDLGTLAIISAVGVIRGTVAFSDNPTSPPTVSIEVTESGGTTTVAQDSTDATGAFEIHGLQTGTYDLAFDATGYLETVITGVEFINGQDTDVGTVTLDPGCATQFEFIEVLGDFNNWIPSGRMTQIASCVWADTLSVTASGDSGSVYFLKFRTDGSWDSPNDLGTCTTQDDVHGLEGDICLVSGEGTALAVRFPVSGEYEFTLDEQSMTYRIEPLAEVERGSISGQVTYEDDPAEPPATTVRVFRAGSAQQIAAVSTEEDGTFLVEDLPAGTYDVLIEASGYQGSAVEGIEVVEGQDTAIGTIMLLAQTECTPSSEIEIVGDFNGWPGEGNGPHATLVDDCLWADTLQVDVSTDPDSTYLFKFRTDERWDDPEDYGSCAGEGFLFEFDGDVVTGQVCEVSVINAIKVKFPATADYRFELDERARTFRIERIE